MTEYSIIIPTYNRAGILKRCLNSIANLKKPQKGFEIIIIDNGSTDNTGEIVESFKNKISNLRYFRDSRPGLHICRHLGCNESKGNILCYLDDDSFVSDGWLLGIEKAFLNSEIILASGLILPEYEETPPEWLKYVWKKCKYGKYLAELSLLDFGNNSKFIDTTFVFGCNFVIRKESLVKFGGFHPDSIPKHLLRFRGDGETGLSRKMEEQNIKAFYSPEIKICHFVPKSRMTSEYFSQRAYAQGISDSYTQYRAENDLYKNKKQLINIDRLLAVKKFLKKITNFSAGINSGYKEYERIMIHAKEFYNQGKLFHRKEVENDLELARYILKENYMNLT